METLGEVSTVSDGVMGRDGMNTLKDVELLEFADETVRLIF